MDINSFPSAGNSVSPRYAEISPDTTVMVGPVEIVGQSAALVDTSDIRTFIENELENTNTKLSMTEEAAQMRLACKVALNFIAKGRLSVEPGEVDTEHASIHVVVQLSPVGVQHDGPYIIHRNYKKTHCTVPTQGAHIETNPKVVSRTKKCIKELLQQLLKK